MAREKLVITNYSRHHEDDMSFFPKVVRMLIVGPSNCGKTNLLLNIILKKWVTFDHLNIFSKTIEQESYSQLRDKYEKLEKEFVFKLSHFSNDIDEFPTLEECKPNLMIVFDDCLFERQNEIKKYFMMGRHKNISCVYLSQSYTSVDKKVIRNNLNFLCVFKQSNTYMKMLWEETVNGDMNLEEFTNMCRKAWSKPHGFLTINLTSKVLEKKYSSI